MLVGSKGERLRVTVNAVIWVAVVTGDGSRVYGHQETRSKQLSGKSIKHFIPQEEK